MSASLRPGLRLANPLTWLLARIVRSVRSGRLVVVTPSGARIEQQGDEEGPDAILVLHRWRAMWRIILSSDVGFAEAYIDGDWSSPDVTALIELATRNTLYLEGAAVGVSLLRAIRRARHLLKANSKRGSRKNIAFHYDLGNDFYRLWLDESMTYSSALYRDGVESLEAAQAAKIDAITERLTLAGGEEILEIGCGWGTLAARLGRRAGHVLGLTLSAEQLAHAQTQVEATELAEKVEFRLQDYREVEGSFDRIVSIEMLEAVGMAYWPIYFDTLRKRLKTGGRVVLQVITIDEKKFEAYRTSPDFIQLYVFPGGMLPTKALVAAHAARAGLTLVAQDYFGASYAMTLAAWRERFFKARANVEALGFSTRFLRVWHYYLSYCEAAFRNGDIDVGLYVFEA